MSYAVKYDPRIDCVVGKIEGKIDIGLVRKFSKSVIEEVNRHKCKGFINDLRKADLKLSSTEISTLPDIILSTGLPSSYKRALIISRDDMKYRFFELESVKRNQNVKVFHTPSEALEWLDKK